MSKLRKKELYIEGDNYNELVIYMNLQHNPRVTIIDRKNIIATKNFKLKENKLEEKILEEKSLEEKSLEEKSIKEQLIKEQLVKKSNQLKNLKLNKMKYIIKQYKIIRLNHLGPPVSNFIGPLNNKNLKRVKNNE